jgi:alpha/beta superfamily hydrolase
LIGIATPVGMIDVGFLARCAKPKLFVHGADDDLAPVAALEEAIRSTMAPPAELHMVQGTGHFFERGYDELADAVSRWAG